MFLLNLSAKAPWTKKWLLSINQRDKSTSCSNTGVEKEPEYSLPYPKVELKVSESFKFQKPSARNSIEESVPKPEENKDVLEESCLGVFRDSPFVNAALFEVDIVSFGLTVESGEVE